MTKVKYVLQKLEQIDCVISKCSKREEVTDEDKRFIISLLGNYRSILEDLKVIEIEDKEVK